MGDVVVGLGEKVWVMWGGGCGILGESVDVVVDLGEKVWVMWCVRCRRWVWVLGRKFG